MSEQVYLYVMSFSLMVNFLIVGFMMFTGIGKDAWQRFIRKRLHRRGGYAYSLVCDKDGNLQEVFENVKEGTFSYNKGKYVRNPRLTKNFHGIPCHFHLEGSVEPIDPWSKHDTAGMSCEELDNIMTANNTLDLREWLEQNKQLLIMVVGAIIVVGALGAYFSYSSLELLRDGTSTVGELLGPK